MESSLLTRVAAPAMTAKGCITVNCASPKWIAAEDGAILRNIIDAWGRNFCIDWTISSGQTLMEVRRHERFNSIRTRQECELVRFPANVLRTTIQLLFPFDRFTSMSARILILVQISYNLLDTILDKTHFTVLTQFEIGVLLVQHFMDHPQPTGGGFLFLLQCPWKTALLLRHSCTHESCLHGFPVYHQ